MVFTVSGRPTSGRQAEASRGGQNLAAKGDTSIHTVSPASTADEAIRKAVIDSPEDASAGAKNNNRNVLHAG
jgi:hypothetical protein